MSNSLPQHHSRKAARVAALYLVFASLWIFASDRFLTLALDDPELLVRIGMVKGFAFVFVTTLLLYLLLRIWDDGKTESGAPPFAAPRLRKLAGLSFGLLLIVPLVGISIVRLYGPQVRETAFSDLRTIAGLKVKQIEDWLDERQSDAEVLAGSDGLALQAERLVRDGNPGARQYVVDRLKVFTKAWDFDSTALLNTAGAVVASATEYSTASAEVRQRLLPAALGSGQVQRSDLYQDASGRIHLDYVIPLRGIIANRRPMTAVLLHAPLERFLFPLIQTWPTPTRSAETLLVRRDGDQVLFLNELRHRHGTAFTLRRPLDTPNFPAGIAVRSGAAQEMEGFDYRGVAVLAVTRPVAGTPWHLVAKIDREEVMAPLQLLVFWVSLVVLVAVSAIAAAALLLWRQMLLNHRLELDAQAVALARASETKYRRLHESMRDAYAVADMSGHLVDSNQVFREMLGYSAEELRDLTYLDLTPEKWHAAEARILREQVLVHGQSQVFEKENIRKDGTLFPVELKISLIRDENGQPEAMWALVRDISDRKRAEAALIASEATYRSLFNNMMSGVAHCRVIVADGKMVDCEYLAVNPGFTEVTGLSGVVGKRISEVIPNYCRDNPESLAVFGEVARSGTPTRWEHYLAALDRWFSFSIYSPAPGEFVVVSDDISTRKKAETEIRELNAALEKKVEERTAQLKSINQELETFTYSVSHDLKAPLRGIDGYSRLLQEEHGAGLNPEGQTFVANIRQGAQQMNQLIEDLLAYSRLERRPLQAAPLAPGEVAAAVVAKFAEEIRLRHARVQVDIPCLEAHADADGLAMILRNLLDNALKFTRAIPQPAIEIGGRVESESCILWVRDNGIGFDMKFQERIFEIFQRLQRAEDYPGTGIGLAIVRKAAQRMGGRVWAESKPGAGAAFYLELPK